MQLRIGRVSSLDHFVSTTCNSQCSRDDGMNRETIRLSGGRAGASDVCRKDMA